MSAHEPNTHSPDGKREDSEQKPFDCPMCGRCIKAVSDVCEPCIEAIRMEQWLNHWTREFYKRPLLSVGWKDTP